MGIQSPSICTGLHACVNLRKKGARERSRTGPLKLHLPPPPWPRLNHSTSSLNLGLPTVTTERGASRRHGESFTSCCYYIYEGGNFGGALACEGTRNLI